MAGKEEKTRLGMGSLLTLTEQIAGMKIGGRNGSQGPRPLGGACGCSQTVWRLGKTLGGRKRQSRVTLDCRESPSVREKRGYPPLKERGKAKSDRVREPIGSSRPVSFDLAPQFLFRNLRGTVGIGLDLGFMSSKPDLMGMLRSARLPEQAQA